jgi:hypothetical protein
LRIVADIFGEQAEARRATADEWTFATIDLFPRCWKSSSAVGDAAANCLRCADLSHTHRAALLRLISSTLRIRRCVLGEKRFYLQVEIIPRPKLESFHENVFRLIPEVPL